MPALVRSKPEPRPAPKPKLSEQLFARLDSLPSKLKADVEGLVKELERELGAGADRSKEIVAALERLSGALQGRIDSAMGEVVQALVIMRGELAELKKDKPPVTWTAEPTRNNKGQIERITFKPREK